MNKLYDVKINVNTLLSNFYELSKREIYNHFGDVKLEKDKNE